nr:ubiquitin-like modifier-activating enzyme atg7 isoform X1 [Megalopta genalis]XP_033337361.1 ubiquitin-like modifier-activating enzyme atg7 isoform X1 [Megalopta genalis]XP_033337362.1 ubiquitin-like modifier-activating enzyme atg7 isoform X1 [Megalopta genalis]XP_033337363.1 ubiquitin-like modifier-activating enzyme atg7 isoform X1 [Megalopta genalis]XP_033337364.1 ubiquitin-like modifier-activating enzyme atg7 isoform X1 [Megalopta genalis]XP_033337365.1 ubiquitin-like modifier-activating 
MSKFVKFTKLRTSTDHTFWAKFAELKIDKLKLDEKAVINIWGSYSRQSPNEANVNPLVLDFTSFNKDPVDATLPTSSIYYCGKMINKNTLEAFKQTNPEVFIESLGKDVIESIKDGSSLKEPWRLSLFLLLAYSDLKKYKFYYWVAHPTPLKLPEMYYEESPKSIDEEFTSIQSEDLSKGFLQLHGRSMNYFTVLISCENNIIVSDVETGVNSVEGKKESQEYNEVYFAFYDPCTSSEPGWPLRNLLSLLLWHCPMHCFTKVIKVISIRGNKAQRSIVYKLRVKQYENTNEIRDSLFNSHLVGWESNTNGKLGPNIADLSDTMDPTRLSDRAINLNLKLMKWRLVPNLDLEKISSLKCLLLGAGTLGCAVARVLLGWGVSNITFVDNSNVSHSNTVRQSLYSHQDAVEHKFKALAAKDALLSIRPNMTAEGVVLHIPMPGHVLGKGMMESTQESLAKLEELVESSDVVFFLLDSREARWLPTVLCAAMNKIAINAALGFDSFTVQRHGTRNTTIPSSPDLDVKNPDGPDLGCYFCNDVTQPGNSQTDRTLDQQCTVSRPGLSQIAAGLAVELLVSVLQHPKGIEAGALMGNNRETINSSDAELAGLLGGVPHTIRGSLWNYEMQLTITHRFTCCTACSLPVVTEYKNRGLSFVVDACNVPNYLEKLSGLEHLLKRPDLDELCYTLDNLSDDDCDVDQLKDAP